MRHSTTHKAQQPVELTQLILLITQHITCCTVNLIKVGLIGAPIDIDIVFISMGAPIIYIYIYIMVL
jgi:hypothetical protein